MDSLERAVFTRQSDLDRKQLILREWTRAGNSLILEGQGKYQLSSIAQPVNLKMQHCAILLVGLGLKASVPFVGRRTALLISEMILLLASSLHLTGEELGIRFGHKDNALKKITTSVSNGALFGIQNAKMVTIPLVAVSVLQNAMAWLMVASFVLRTHTDEELEPLLV